MPTNLAIEDRLLEEARILGGQRTKREIVNAALIEYIQRRQRLSAIEGFGTIDFDPSYDYKQARRDRLSGAADCSARRRG